MAQDSDVQLAVGLDTYREMHRMLAVYEIISNILQNCQRHDQAVAARVSRLWYGVVLDWLWRDIDSVLPLLRLLSPLVDTKSGLAFAETIEARNWERFRYYGRRVRCLRYDDRDPDGRAHLASSSFASDFSVTLLALKPAGFGALLPNIQELHWTASRDVLNLQHALPFLHSSVKALDISVDNVRVDDVHIIARFLRTVSGIHGLRLETFKFKSIRATLQLYQNFATLLQNQQTIRVLDIEVGHLPDPNEPGPDLPHPVLPKELKELITSLNFDGLADYLTRARALVRQVPHLHSLELYPDGPWSWWPLGFHYLTPFLELSELKNLELFALEGIHLDPDDIGILSKSFPKMVRFAIKPWPQPRFELGIKATTLIDFAAAFPNLEALGIRIERIDEPLELPWRSTDNHSHSQPQAYPSFNSSTFQLLDVGPSFLSDDDIPDMAELLSVLCPSPLFEIKYEQLEGEREPQPDSTEAWRKVEALVKLVHGTERDTTKPYHEWCQALILDNVDIEIDEDEESMIAEGEVA
ncbi:hypothetical protein FRC05_009493 [Tulasnella sp. 425]|nr:hypothetical protein FRC05_009493 [Tulasnella sp. 425]